MRWYWIDRFLEFESGRYAKAIKNISLAEDYLHDHFPYYPLIPNSLVIEGMAQTGGLLVCEHNQFTEKVVLAKMPKAVFYCEATPGDTLTYTATIEYIRAGRGDGHGHQLQGRRAARRGGDRLRPPERLPLGQPVRSRDVLADDAAVGGVRRGPRRRRQPASGRRRGWWKPSEAGKP